MDWAEPLCEDVAQARYERLKEDAEWQIADGERELEKRVSEADEKLADAKDELLDGEKEIPGKSFHNRVWKYGKQLVCCGCPVEGISAVFNAAAKLACHFIGMGSHVIEEAVLKQLFKLDTKKPSFCQHGALLFDEETEILL